MEHTTRHTSYLRRFDQVRVYVQYTVHGSTLEELIKNATTTWKSMSGLDALPNDADIAVVDSENPAYDYAAVVHIRTKKEQSA